MKGVVVSMKKREICGGSASVTCIDAGLVIRYVETGLYTL